MGKKMRNTDATNQMMGYKIQEYYALELLLKNRNQENGNIVIEYIDDVCFLGGKRVLYQLKYHNDGKNHITDADIDFWKSIYNWLNKIKKGDINDEDELILIIYQKAKYDANCFQKRMSQAKTEKQIISYYDDISSWYKDKYENQDIKKISKYLDEIFKQENKDNMFRIIKKFELIVLRKVDSLDEMIHKYFPGIIGTDYFDKIVSKLNTEFQRWYQKSYYEKQRIIIDIKEFNQMIDKYVDRIANAYKFSNKTLKEEVEEKVLNSQNQNLEFVNQLKAMHLMDEKILEETYNYFRTIEDIKNYLQEDLLTYNEYYVYRDNQYEEWQGKRYIYMLNTIKNALAVFGECRSIKNKLSNEEMDIYFHMGNFHKMLEEGYKNFYWYKVDKK